MPAERAAPELVPLVRRVAERIGREPLPRDPVVSFYAYVDTKSTIRLKDGRLHLRLSDHLLDAPGGVLEGAASVLLCRLWGRAPSGAERHAVAAYEHYIRREDLDVRRGESRRLRGRKHLDPVGRHRSLLESFLRVTMDLGLRPPEVPRLGWSREVSRRRFGHWDADHGCIIISRVLDDDRVPGFVLDHVMFHEVLHIVHPVEYGPRRRRVHTPAFKADEARFPRLAEAEAWLTHLASGRSPARPPRIKAA